MKRLSILLLPLALVVTSVAVVGTGVADAGKARSATIQPFSVVFTKGSTILSTVSLKPGQGLDVKWKSAKCYGGYDSPPVAATWDGLATGAFAPTMFAPCHVSKASVRHNLLNSWSWWCGWDSNGNFSCGWDWSSSSALAAVANSLGAKSASLNLSKGHITGATSMANGKLTTVKVQVPTGTTGVHWVGPQQGIA
jgi:hypothetical protein